MNSDREQEETQEIVLGCQGLSKVYNQGPQVVNVLQDVNLQIRAGERVAIVGSSGSGKTTLLNMLGGLDLPTGGTIMLAGQDISTLGETERGQLRNRYLGFVYQFHHLLGEFTALENVCMPLLIGGTAVPAAREQAGQILARVGLEARLHHKPSELSGGERQRVAIARALVTRPRCVLLDEPTGNLDRRTAMGIRELMTELSTELSTSFVVVTHDEGFAETLDRVLLLEGGKLHEQGARSAGEER